MAQTGYIYKLCCRDPTIKDVYIGSTKNLRVRKGQHKCNCNNQNCKNYKYNVYRFMRDNGGFDNFDLIQLEQIEYDTKNENHARERHYIEVLNATLKKCVPNRTHVNHRNEIIAKQKIRGNIKHNCVCGGKYTQVNKAQHFATNKHLLYLANQVRLGSTST